MRVLLSLSGLTKLASFLSLREPSVLVVPDTLDLLQVPLEPVVLEVSGHLEGGHQRVGWDGSHSAHRLAPLLCLSLAMPPQSAQCRLVAAVTAAGAV